MTPTVDQGKVDKAVAFIRGRWGQNWANVGGGFQGDEAKDSLQKLAELNSEEFKIAWAKLDFQPLHTDEIRHDLAVDAHHEGVDDQKYSVLIQSLELGNFDLYYKVKQNEEARAEKLEFGKYYTGNPFSSLALHAELVHLIPPEGASKALCAMVDGISFNMQYDFDTMGLRKGKEALPVLSRVLLADEQATSLTGWSDAVRSGADMQKQLKSYEDDFQAKHQIAVDATYDSKITGDNLFKNLIQMKNDIQAMLATKLAATRDGEKLIKTTKDRKDGSEIQEVRYERVKDATDDRDDDKFYLTPQAEQMYYVQPLMQMVKQWEAAYKEAASKFQAQAADVHPPDLPPPSAAQQSAPQSTKPAVPPQDVLRPGAEDIDYTSLFQDELGADPVISNTSPETNAAGPGTMNPTAEGGYSSAVNQHPQGSTNVPASSNIGDMSQVAQLASLTQAMQMMGNRNQNDSDRRDRRRPSPRREPIAALPDSTPHTAPAPIGSTPNIKTPSSAKDAIVPSAVEQALTRERNNPNGCDARAAYSGTPGLAWPGTPVTESELRTGDVVLWSNNVSALVEMTESGARIIFKGEPIEFDAEHLPPELRVKFGTFGGFFRPIKNDDSRQSVAASPVSS
ncbi:hypothetical protein [Nocardia jejuensis]|uniref:hypothetical protein n=1 Tax=Nocardia jejuensis TaxID=328049 RepID=UPI000A442002|nr:hypothetical protein [Nocardia jejuensis]